MRRLAFILDQKNNNFTLIRLIAALMVLYGHAFSLYPTNGRVDVFSQLSHFTNSGSFGVNTFFFLSGMFVTGSFDKLKNPLSYSVRRVLRLVPALFVCVTITVFIIGPIVTTVPLKYYFTSPISWKYELFNATVIKIMHKLPGVFTTNHLPNDVNGSLWTLALEVKCYLIILLFGVLQVFKKKQYTLLVFALLIVLYFVPIMQLRTFMSHIEFILFMAGSLAYVFSDSIRIDYKIAVALILITIIASKYLHPWFEVPFWATIIYLMLMLGSSSIAKKIKLPGDYSYGIYIYSFLVQQFFAHYFPSTTSCQSFLMVLPVTVALSIASWHLIEKRAIDLGHRIFKARAVHTTHAI